MVGEFELKHFDPARFAFAVLAGIASTTNAMADEVAPVPARADQSLAASDESDDDEHEDAASADTAKPAKHAKKKKKKKKNGDAIEVAADDDVRHLVAQTAVGSFELKGRVYARAELQRFDATIVDVTGISALQRVDSLDLSVPSARATLHYRSPARWLAAELEVDFAGKPDLKDAYVQAKGAHVGARAGQFKMPVSAFEMTSPWQLPLVRRGFLSDLLVDRLDVAGRRPGATVSLRDRDGIHPQLTVGAFQGSVVVEEGAGTRKTSYLSGQTLAAQSYVARGQVEVGPATIGAYYEHRLGTPAVLESDHYWTAGADVVVDHTWSNGGIRAWADGLAGASWFETAAKTPDGRTATFTAARGLVAFRSGGTVPDQFYVEPFGLLGVLDPDVGVTADLAFEAVAGVNVGLWQRARIALQGEMNRVQRNFPSGYFLGRSPDRVGLLLQAGVAF